MALGDFLSRNLCDSPDHRPHSHGEAAYSYLERPLHPGDRYVLYTNGLPESKNATGEEFGLSRCLKVVDSHARLPAAAFADQLLSEISSWTAQDSVRLQEEDMTLIVIDCQGGPSPSG
jgi:phosphoserine phosphatase RsbU/P